MPRMPYPAHILGAMQLMRPAQSVPAPEMPPFGCFQSPFSPPFAPLGAWA